jgi:hypothetical protein
MAEIVSTELGEAVDIDSSNFPVTNWVKHIADDGVAYYYDKAAKVSKWKIPSVFLNWKSAELHKYKWKEAKNKDEGTVHKYPVYYYNRETKVTQWVKPVELLDFERRLDEVISNNLLKKKRKVDVEEKTVSAEVTSKVVVAEIPSEEDRDLLLSLLSKPDFVLEECAEEVMQTLIDKHQQDQKSIISRLTGSYTGTARMLQVVAEWLFLADSIASANTEEELEAKLNVPIDDAEHDEMTERIISAHLSEFAKKTFNKSLADKLIVLTSKPPRWLSDMMKDPTWRQLLLDLIGSTKDSALLNYCLREISKMGYHR